jgi:hypothetical protein
MNLELKIAFDSEVSNQFTINNPPYVPTIGEIVDIVPEDFTDNAEDIRKLNEYSENDIWLVGFKSIKYYKDRVRVLIVLEKEEDFKKESL